MAKPSKEWIEQQIRRYEQRYQMTSDAAKAAVIAGTLAETPDIYRWMRMAESLQQVQ